MHAWSRHTLATTEIMEILPFKLAVYRAIPKIPDIIREIAWDLQLIT